MPFAEYLSSPPTEITRDDATHLMHRVLTDAQISDGHIAALLAALAARAVTAAELAGFADALRALAIPVPFTEAERATLVDTCGTGGDNSGTFNISTGAALVAAAAGAKIAKHGNRGVTSRCGSADVLEALGISVALSPMQSVECLRQTRFAFLYAPALHPALKRILPIRRALGFRTIFNLLGPLTNPAHAAAQVLGVSSAELVPVFGHALTLLQVRRALVIHGADGVDELTLHGASSVAEVENGAIAYRRFSAPGLGLAPAPLSELAGGDAADNARILRDIFSGKRGSHRDIVVLNAAAALVVAGIADDLHKGVEKASLAIDNGSVIATVEALNQFRALIQDDLEQSR